MANRVLRIGGFWGDAKYALYIRQKLEKDLRDLDEGRNCMQESAEQHLLGQRTM